MRELTLLCYAENILSNDDFLVLWEDNQSKNPDFPWDRYSPFGFENMNEAESKAEFPVEKRDLHTLREVLEIPPTFKCQRLKPPSLPLWLQRYDRAFWKTCF